MQLTFTLFGILMKDTIFFGGGHIYEEINNSLSIDLMMQLTVTLLGILMKEIIFFFQTY